MELGYGNPDNRRHDIYDVTESLPLVVCILAVPARERGVVVVRGERNNPP